MNSDTSQEAITRLSAKRLKLHQRIGAHVVKHTRNKDFFIIPKYTEKDAWERLLRELERVEKALSGYQSDDCE